MARLDWLVVRDFSLIESATWWKDGPEIETGELRTGDIGTEVFFLPAAAHTEKDGSFTNTQRMLQWHHQAVEPPGDARSDLWFIYHLGQRIRAKLAGIRPMRWTAGLDLTWDYPVKGSWRSRTPRQSWPRSTAGTPTASPLSAYTELKDDGSTTCGCWIYCGVTPRGQPGRPPQAGPRAELGGTRMGLGLAGQPPDPVQPGLADPDGSRGANARPGLVGRGAKANGRPRRARLRAGQGTGLPPAGRRDRAGGALGPRSVHHAGRR